MTITNTLEPPHTETQDDPFPAMEMTYAGLPDVLHQRVGPYGASKPELLRINKALLDVLGFNHTMAENGALAADVFSGNRLAAGMEPLAMAYAGHQFGGFVPQLGDGRALLLGEILGKDGLRRDIQLKGSGQTRYSRQGDGRAALGPVLREYVVAEAMHALGIPTSRALAAVITGDPVLRDGVQPGAIVTRVASSHLRVGTFEFAAIQRDPAVLQALVDYAIIRHPPGDAYDGPDALRLLKSVVERQAKLVAQWMGIGFIHGVMNTDNCTLSGETIDYGPCAFMDHYDPAQVYSSIDHMGRYAYNQQPQIAHWNMAVFAQALLPLIDPDEDTAVQRAQDAVNTFPGLFSEAYGSVMRSKLGLSGAEQGDGALVKDLQRLMADIGADFTNTFATLSRSAQDTTDLSKILGDGSADWITRWQARLVSERDAVGRMASSNPKLIPRNHRLEAMIASAYDGDMQRFHAITEVLSEPYSDPETSEGKLLTMPPDPSERVDATFCGT